MSTTRARIARLQKVWPTAPLVTVFTETDTGHLKFWSRPLFPGEFRDYCTARAHERYITTVRGGRYGGQSFIDPCWHTGGVTDEERKARIQFEYDELERLVALLGLDEGWGAWHAQAQDWPQRNGKIDADALDRRLMHAWTTADNNRVSPGRPLWRKVWVEWKPGMTLDEHFEFDQLLGREGETRCARW